MATFIGEFDCKVDLKGRINLPMAFKKKMPADSQDHFVVRKDIFENCLVLYAIEDWNMELDKIQKIINTYDPEHNMFMRNFFMGTAELFLDNNNRLLVPKRLLDLIGGGRDVLLAGQLGRIEIWAPEEYAKKAMSARDFSDLSQRLFAGRKNDSEI